MIFTLVGWLVQATARGTVAILLIAVAERLIGGRVRARWRYALWLIIVWRLVVPIAPSSTWSIFNLVPAHPGIQLLLRGAPGQIVLSAGASPVINVPWWIAGWKWIATIWICGIIALAARALIATARIHSIIRRAAPSRGDARRIVDEVRRQLGIKRSVRVVESAFVDAPALHGVFQPTLLLPEGLSETFAPDGLRHVILHELWHLRRHDIAVNWLLTAVQALHWFNPFVWFAISRIAEERELACDELTLSCLEERERFGYGRTMLELLERFHTPESVPALVGIVNHKQKMKRRLMMIGAGRKQSPLAIPALAALAAICLATFTDARGGDHAVLGTLDPAAVQKLDRLNGPVTFDLTNGSLPELLNTVSNKSGVVVTQSATIACSPVRQARFTVHAKNVAAHAVLMKALLPFGLVAEPNASGMKITKGPSCIRSRSGNPKPLECGALPPR